MSSLQIPFTLPILSRLSTEPTINKRRKVGFLSRNGFNMKCSIKIQTFLYAGSEKDWILTKRKLRGSAVVRANQGFGGGGGGWDKESTKRVLGNLGLAVGLTYLSMTGQLGWILDAIVSIWLLAVLLPIVGLGIFFWYASRDIVQGSCPNCGNDFQILKSSLNDGVQLCPFCTQPFSVQDNKFVRKAAKFSSGRPNTTERVFNGFSRGSDKGKASSAAIVDIEAEVNDIE